ncbi:plastocyanin/azurin family copper-binding protein [Marinicella sediminis]|uniref:Plastocyanin/azurin family copper-binding protein n=1 Tax=Marinicella sediminis TaxID=1792834 RepID=A0ABV7J780_9GAMM|nr:plastocyanin/azurin family copper-binding protein [Marinicella sediminis]
MKNPQVTKYAQFWLLTLCMVSLTVSAAVHEVIVQDNSFSPATVVIEAGDTVRWINQGPGAHNIYAVGRFRCANGCEAEGGNGNPSNAAWVAEVTFRVPETIPYECQPHVNFGMVGTIVVNQPADAVVPEITANPDNTFSPTQLTIMQGDVVFFRNAGGEHNIHSNDDGLICADGCVGDGQNADADPTGFPWEFYHRFAQPGTVILQCDNPAHPAQLTTIEVISELIFSNGFD